MYGHDGGAGEFWMVGGCLPVRIRINGDEGGGGNTHKFVAFLRFAFLQFAFCISILHFALSIFKTCVRKGLSCFNGPLACLQSSMRWLNFAAISGKPHAKPPG